MLTRLTAGESITLTLSAAVPSVVAELTLAVPCASRCGRFRPRVAPAAGPPATPLLCVAVEDLTWTQDLRRELALAKERLAKVMGTRSAMPS